MSRLSHVPLDQWDPQLRSLTAADSATPLEQGLMRVIAHMPEMAKGLIAFAGALKVHRTLPERLMELMRLRIAFFNQCRSCMAIRYTDAIADGLTERAVCSLERPQEAADLTPAEKAAIRYGELLATDHLRIDDSVYDDLRQHFSEAQIVELGLYAALCVGFGRLGATWHMVEELPEGYQANTAEPLAPWHQPSIQVR
jgi:alkylhydroperoxidase family enzyme